MLPDGCIWVPAQRLAPLSPLDRPFWTRRSVFTERVWAAVEEQRLIDMPLDPEQALWLDPEAHAERVAFFVVHGLSDQDFIEIDVGAPELGCYVEEPVQDGNHRLAGALLRGDPLIACSIGGGEREIGRRFGAEVASILFDPAFAA